MKTREKPRREAVDESGESEITIQPDGRVFAFGITATLAEVLGAIPTRDARTRLLLARMAGLAKRPEEATGEEVGS